MIIGVLDSGIGGVAVMKELLRLPLKNRYIYYSDNRYAPYGSLNEIVLTERVLEISEFLVEQGAEAILLLCNTATTVVLEVLRAVLSIPVYGVRPHFLKMKDKTLVLSTMLTAKRLLRECVEYKNVEVLGLRSLSLEIEDAAPDFFALRPYLETLLAPYRSYKTICLACTHYVHLAPLIQDLLPNAELRNGIEPLLNDVSELCERSLPTKPSEEKKPDIRHAKTASEINYDASGKNTRGACDSEIEFIFSGENKEKLYRKVLFGR